MTVDLLARLVISDTPEAEALVTALLTVLADLDRSLNAKAVALGSAPELTTAESDLRLSRLPLGLPMFEGLVMASAPDGAYWTWDVTITRLPGSAWSVARRLEWARHAGRKEEWELLWEAANVTCPTSEALARELPQLVDEVMALEPTPPLKGA